MATIIKKIKKGRPYYYAVQSKRVDGKPRIVWQKYLGTVDGIIARTDEAKPPKPKEAVIFQAGGVAALYRIAQRLDLMEIINEIVPKRDQGPTVGHYIILAALNRALSPKSKSKIGEWYDETVLRRLWGFKKEAFATQRFWDHMDRISEEDIENIQKQLLRKIKEKFDIDAQLLLYDTTNFFTFLATTNDRCELAQRGKNKQKRNDLRQLGLALMVSSDFQIPLFHHVYEGNTPDVTLFPELTKELVQKHKELTGVESEATLVFDKGNVSDDAMEDLVVSPMHFVLALSAGSCADLLKTPLEQFEQLDNVAGTQVFEVITDHWAKTCKAVVVYTESFFSQQLNGVTTNLVKCQKKLAELTKRLKRWEDGKGSGKKPTILSVKKSILLILSQQFMRELFVIEIKEGKKYPKLVYRVNHKAFSELTKERLGRTVLITDRTDWSAEKIVKTYRSLSEIEDAFKNMKNVDYLRWRPSYHWTDSKLRVHALYCVLALLLSSLARKEIVTAGVELTLPAMLEELTKIREVAVIYPMGSLAHRKDHITLSRMSPRQKKLAKILEIGEILNP